MIRHASSNGEPFEANNAFARLKSTKHLSLVEHIRYKDEVAGSRASTTPAAPETQRIIDIHEIECNGVCLESGFSL